MRPAERRAALMLLATVTAVGLALAFAAPRLTLVNTGVRVAYPWSAWAGPAAAAACAALAARLVRGRAGRAALVLVAAGGAVLGLARGLYAVEAGTEAIVQRGLAGRAAVPWAQVTRVEAGPGAIDVWGAGEARVRIDTTRLAAEQRAALERAVSRRVRPGRPAS